MAEAMQLSTRLSNYAAEGPIELSRLIDFARAAEEAGLDRLVVADHVALGEHLDAYGDPSLGGSLGGALSTGPDGLWLEPLTTIAFLCGITRTVRFETAILLAALRRPVVLAKVAATIDVLSGGRLDLGVGVGWQREEYVAAGLSFEDRGRLLNHTIEVCQALWREQSASYSSDELSFEGLHQMPKPTQAGGVPVWVSGTVNARSMDRLANYGVGWIPWGRDAAELGEGIAAMRAAMHRRGRDPDELGVVGTLRGARDPHLDLKVVMAEAPRLRDLGVTDLRVGLTAPEGARAATEYLRGVVAAFNEALA